MQANCDWFNWRKHLEYSDMRQLQLVSIALLVSTNMKQILFGWYRDGAETIG